MKKSNHQVNKIIVPKSPNLHVTTDLL